MTTWLSQARLRCLAFATTAGLGLTLVAAEPSPPPPLALRLIAFNDFHGHLEPAELSLSLADPANPRRTVRVAVGGAAALAGLVRTLREDAAHSLLLSTGDLVGATPLVSAWFRHESTVDVMNRVGLDVGVLGNHEFDAGPAELLRLLRGGCAPGGPAGGAGAGGAAESCALGPFEGARFVVLAANVHRQDGGGTLLAPHVVREVDGVKLGIVGAVTRGTPWIVTPSGVAGLRFEDEAEAINRSVAVLQAQGVRAIVALVHEGGQLAARDGAWADWNDATCPGAQGEIFALARRISPAVAAIFSAHTHQGYRCEVDGRPLLQAVANGRGVSVVDLVLDRRTGEVDRRATRSRNLPVFNERSDTQLRAALTKLEPAPWAAALQRATPDAAVAARVADYARLAAPRAERVVGRIGGSFDRGGRTDSAAGRLVADAQWAATRSPAQGGAQLALTNAGGLRSDLACAGPPPCPVTYAQAFALQPFGNSLVVMTLTGRELKALLESQQRGDAGAPHFLSPSAGLSYRWQARRPPGQRVQELRLNGRAVAETQPLRVTVNSYLAEGGDGFSLLRQGRDRLGGPLDVDALVDFLAHEPRPTAAARISRSD